MKNKIYNVLSYIAAVLVVVFAIILGANYYIDKSVVKINDQIAVSTKTLNDSLDNGKVVHNLFVKNCIMGICGKVSFFTASIAKDGVVIKEGEEYKKENRDLYELLSSQPVDFKLNPITQMIEIKENGIEFVLLKNKKKVVSLNAKDVMSEFSLNAVASSSSDLTLDNLSKVLETVLNITINKGTIYAEDDLVVNFDELKISTSGDVKDAMLSQNYKFYIDQLKSNDENFTGLNMNIDLDVNNIDLAFVQKYLDILNKLEISDVLDNSDQTEYLVEMANSAIKFVEDIDKNKTNININNYTVDTLNKKDSTVASSLMVMGNLSLDADLDPVVDLSVKMTESDANQTLANLELGYSADDNTQVKPFIKVDDNTVTSKVKIINGDVIINDKKAHNVSGIINGYVSFAKGMLSMMSMR